ncbi:Disease resistance protein (CC-NBS-LRR class) family [Rhynchospora pubera]|uniref:Disease resistance protein (CC-NBS-LRR class) family n=1 Tax=Rhynchospora pubera TaxID=906938 RepID=A0AAV8FZY2_9POAL|nr:Disease resistance protein (CC-NBS-LRR class) family [Rhynchospora pubera]
MAEITAAVGWVVSPVIKMVIEKIKTFIEKKYFEKSSIVDDMTKMNTTLPEILSTMTTVEKYRIVDPYQVQLVRQIKDAVYDAEDCIDDFDYKLAKEEYEKSLPNKVRRVTASCSRFINRTIVGNSSFKKKLTRVNERLDQANRSAEKLLKLMEANKSGNMQLIEQEYQFLTSSVPSGETIFGREKERELIIEWIIEEKAGPPTIIPIVGQGGLGKTTLAQMVFNDPRLNSHFESNKKLWLTVSDKFDKRELTKQMLKYLCESFSANDASFDMLQRKLQTELSSKEILLVLDDVWYGKHDKKYRYEKDWSEFLAPLSNAKAKSTIIITTREDLVVNSLASLGSIRPISLDALNDDDGWSLLKLKAFDCVNPDNLHDLEPIGRKIVNKLKGLPLAIRVVGPRLRGKFDMEEWKRILKDDSLDNDIIEVLHRSYEHLPGHLQRCFAYCSLFPKDYYLKRDRLVHMWIAHGFVFPKEGERLEDVGKSYFNELISRSFIQVIERNNKEYYVVHDLMKDLACHVSQGECYILKENHTLQNLGSIRHLSVITTRRPISHHHLSIEFFRREYYNLITCIRGLDKLRTLILLYPVSGVLVDLSSEVFIKMKRIRVLNIDCNLRSFKLPNFGECKHLRYLCFRNCEVEPEYFSKLHLLTTLFIRKRDKSENIEVFEIPHGSRMSRLEVFDTSKLIKSEIKISTYSHIYWRFFILVNLRERFAELIAKERDWWEIGDLRDFNNIKGKLEISRLEYVASREEAIEAQLGSKEHVTQLWLTWNYRAYPVKGKEYILNEILEALRPHPNVERLMIHYYPGDKFPSWLEPNWLSRMTHFWIQGSNYGFKMLPTLGQFSQLKEVYFQSIHTVSKIGDEFYGNGIFPSLELLKIYDMRRLETWSSPCRVYSFPKLSTLELYSCPGLFSLPEIESFCSIESVEIVNCPKIRSLPKLPVSLRYLKIKKVHPDLEEQLGNKNGAEWDKVAAILGCRCETYRAETES